MSFVNPFAPRPRGVEADVARVKTMVRGRLGLAGDTGVTVSEIVCRDPACPGIETVILVMPVGEPTRLIRIPGSIAEVSVEALARSAGSTDRAPAAVGPPAPRAPHE